MTPGNLCLPVKIHLVFAILSVIFNTVKYSAQIAIGGLVFDGIYAYFMEWMCMRGYLTFAWILLLLPVIVIGLTVGIIPPDAFAYNNVYTPYNQYHA